MILKKINELIAAGTHFWCKACVVTRPFDDRSPDPRYCIGCYEVISADKNDMPNDSWVKNDSVFIHYGKGYCVGPKGENICIGPVDRDGNRLESHPDNLQDKQEDVSKLPAKELVMVKDSQNQKEGSFDTLIKHPGGRPRKNGNDLSRMTRWRRKQEEKQGILL